MTRTFRVLAGPTAAGKTAWLLARVQHCPLLVISADSRQVYRHMRIGTGQPTPAEREILPHHGIDFWEPGAEFSVYRFLTMAAEGLELAADRNRQPWVCGGTGLYLRALVEELELGPAPRPRLRAALRQRLETQTPRALARELGLVLKEPDNPVRVVRWAEHACADPGTAQRIYAEAGLDPDLAETDGAALGPGDGAVRDTLHQWRCLGVAVLDPGREELAKRIALRVRKMFAGGLVEEVAELRRLGYGGATVVRDGIGYREAGQVLDGVLQVDEAVERTVIRTRQYAKRQRTYFRGRGWPRFAPSELEEWVGRKDAEPDDPTSRRLGRG